MSVLILQTTRSFLRFAHRKSRCNISGLKGNHVDTCPLLLVSLSSCSCPRSLLSCPPSHASSHDRQLSPKPGGKPPGIKSASLEFSLEVPVFKLKPVSYAIFKSIFQTYLLSAYEGART